MSSTTCLGGDKDADLVTMRIMFCLVKNDTSSHVASGIAKLRVKAMDAIKERQTRVERQQQLAERENDVEGRYMV